MKLRWSLGMSCVLLAVGAAAACSDDPVGNTPDAGADTSITPVPDANVPDTSTAPDAADAAPPPDFTAAELAALSALSPLPALPPDPTNAYADNAKAAELGQMLFFEKSYSGPIVIGSDGTNGGLGAVGERGKVSCASCHGGLAMEDNRSKPSNLSIGIDRGTRNALAIVNSAYQPWTNWGGRFDSQWSLAPTVAENPRNMASTRLEIAHMIFKKYRTEYDAIFPDKLDPDLDPASANASRFPLVGKPGDASFDGMTDADKVIVNRIAVNYGKAIAAYQRKLVSGNSAFDKYIAGDKAALTQDAKRGAKVFVGKGACVTCHSGPTFSDGKFHALAVPQAGPNAAATDLGRFQDVPGLLSSPFNVNGAYSDNTNTGKLTGLAQDPSQRGQFRTPTLRNIAKSGPYMHTGHMTTLEDVVTFYAAGGGDPGDAGITKDPLMKPFTVSGTDVADLVAFMKALDGAPITPALLQDTSKP